MEFVKHRERIVPSGSLLVMLSAVLLVSAFLPACQPADQATRDLQARKLDKRYRPEQVFDENATAFDNLNVQVGDLAPEISGPDVDGVEFCLSDYRGKVVLLQYWANW